MSDMQADQNVGQGDPLAKDVDFFLLAHVEALADKIGGPYELKLEEYTNTKRYDAAVWYKQPRNEECTGHVVSSMESRTASLVALLLAMRKYAQTEKINIYPEVEYRSGEVRP